MPGRFILGLVGLASATAACGAIVGTPRGDGDDPSAVHAEAADGAHAMGASSGGAHGERLARAIRGTDLELGQRDGWVNGCPPEMASVEGRYCVDKWEASLVEVLPNGDERPWSPYQSIEGHTVRAVSSRGTFPQGYISAVQAKEACTRSGKRLCSKDEWQAACMGPRHTTFPYGEQREAKRCNDHGRSPVLATYGVNWQLGGHSSRTRHANWDRMNAPVLNQLAGTLARTGDHDGCTNEYGVYDMVGNLHEWVDDPDGSFYGGFYQDTHQHGDGCTYVTTAHVATYHDYSTGFRCCADPAR